MTRPLLFGLGMGVQSVLELKEQRQRYETSISHNIPQGKVTMITSLTIDSREPKPYKDIAFDDAPAVVLELPHGDFMLTTSDGAILCVERKTVNDLLSSIKDGRLPKQVAGMRAITPWTYVIIEGALYADGSGAVVADGMRTGWAWRALQGALETAQELGAVLHYTGRDPSAQATKGSLLHLANRERGDVRVKPTRNAQPLSMGEVVLEAIPSIGKVRARELLRHVGGSAAWALVALTGDDEVDGIGPKTKEDARRALGLRENERVQIDAPL